MDTDLQRRQLLVASAAGMLTSLPGAALAQAMAVTPRQTPGPFYPDDLPLDDDNDLTRVAGIDQPAKGVATRLRGRVLDSGGQPIRDARVEIWQCDANGRYHHQRDRQRVPPDPGFQGFGHSVSNDNGEYVFRTIKPVPYPGRTPHIHFRVLVSGAPELTTQMYIAGEPRNARDGLYNRLRPEERQRVTVALKQSAQSGELGGQFDIVLL